MDPNVTIANLRAMVKEVNTGGKGLSPRDVNVLFAWWFEQLDEWLSSGGFLPDDWAPCRHDQGVKRKFDGGRLALVCKRCYVIVGYDMRNEV